jgi:hypothetical protein
MLRGESGTTFIIQKLKKGYNKAYNWAFPPLPLLQNLLEFNEGDRISLCAHGYDSIILNDLNRILAKTREMKRTEMDSLVMETKLGNLEKLVISLANSLKVLKEYGARLCEADGGSMRVVGGVKTLYMCIQDNGKRLKKFVERSKFEKEIVKHPNWESLRKWILRVVGSLAAGYAGFKLGAVVGTVALPGIGTLAGGTVGAFASIVSSGAGLWAGNKVNDACKAPTLPPLLLDIIEGVAGKVISPPCF